MKNFSKGFLSQTDPIRKKFLSNGAGFTLVESLISIIILAIILIGGMTFYFNSDIVLTLANHKKIALEITHDELEDLKNIPYNSVDSTLMPFPVITVGSFNYTHRAIVTFEDDPDEGATLEDYKKVEVKVTWDEANETGTREVSMTTFIAP